MVKIASYNVENLFERPKALDPLDWSFGKQALKDYEEVNSLFANLVYSSADKQRMIDLLVNLEIYSINQQGAIRRKNTVSPKWAWFRKNRGAFDRQPSDSTKDIEIIANGRADWNGWVELAKEPVNEKSILMTAKVIKEIDADIIGLVEAEDRTSLVRFNDEILGGLYKHIMVIDGNDNRGIDVGIMTKDDFNIESIVSNVDTVDGIGKVFSRDCPQYQIKVPNGSITVLVNHFKSQSGGGGDKRKRQAEQVKKIVKKLVQNGEDVIVLGDFNEGPRTGNLQADNLKKLYDQDCPLVESYTINGFNLNNRPGTYDSCGLSNRLDYIFISNSLKPKFIAGEIFRKGLWGTRKTRPTNWTTYPEMTKSSEQASDHAAVTIELNI